jgi:sec-independent protein translocase protein TatC
MSASKFDDERPLVSHLLELRSRLLRSVVAVLVAFLALYPFSDTLFEWISSPLRALLPEGALMIAIKPIAPFVIPLKLTLLVAFFAAIPYLLYQIWAFIAPGLYRHERRLVWPLMASSTLLFYLGAAFAYFLVLPTVFAFMSAVAPEGVLAAPDIGEYLDFVLTLFIAFGAAFEVPIATILLVYSGVTTREKLRAARPYVIVGAFIAGAILTPPDVLSQVMLAVPVWMLFELGLFASGWVSRQRRSEEGGDVEP